MKSRIKLVVFLSLIGAALGVCARANPVITVDFSSPTTLLQGTGTLVRTLGDTGTYSLGTWVYSAVGEINLNSSGIARIRNNTSSNARAISVILDASPLVAGTEYTLSFDVIGVTSTNDSGRFWLAEVSGYGAGSTVFTNVAPGTGTWATNISPYTTTGSAQVNFLGGMANTGVLINNENVAGTTTTSLNFTYSGGPALAFAVGTYNNDFAIDNVTISIAAVTAIPEPSTYALMALALPLCLAFYRRSRRAEAR